MTPLKDPPRLAESGEPILRQAIDAARADLPGADRMGMLSSALAAKLALGGGGGGGPGSPEPAGPSAAPPAAAPAATAAPAAAAAPAAVKAAGVAVALAIAGGAVWYASRPAPVDTAPLPPPAEVAPAASAPPPEPAATADSVPTVSFETLPSASAGAPAPPAGSASAQEVPAGESEMDVLRHAQDALASDPARALAICSEHQQTFKRSGFAQEREVIAIDALVRLGRRAEAEARADRFAKSWPTSGHLRRIDSLLGR